jgi:hypothetical protein
MPKDPAPVVVAFVWAIHGTSYVKAHIYTRKERTKQYMAKSYFLESGHSLVINCIIANSKVLSFITKVGQNSEKIKVNAGISFLGETWLSSIGVIYASIWCELRGDWLGDLRFIGNAPYNPHLSRLNTG